MKLTAKEILDTLGAGARGTSDVPVAEARTGRYVRVADLKYLREAKGSERLEIGISPEMAAVAEELSPMFLSEGLQDLDGLADFAHKNYRRMREATSASAFGQLLRVGVQTIANDYYLRTPVTYSEYFHEYASKNRMEFHAPLFRSSLPRITNPGEQYKEQPVIGSDVELVNLKIMGGESFENELWEDDQTGQIKGRAESIGEAQRILEEIFCTGMIFGLGQGGSAALTVGTFTAPAPTWSGYNAAGTTLSTVYGVNTYNTNVGNQPASFGQLSAATLKSALTALTQAIDPKGIRIMVRPNHLVVSLSDGLNAEQLLTSELNPAVQGPGGTQFNAQMGGSIGGIMAKNVFQGKLTFSMNYFAPQWAWVLGEKGKGPVFQRRTPMTVIQENPMSGQSFDLDNVRWRSRSRYIPGWIDPRFWYRGNDGTAVGQQ